MMTYAAVASTADWMSLVCSCSEFLCTAEKKKHGMLQYGLEAVVKLIDREL
jgi:hypothetical protein